MAVLTDTGRQWMVDKMRATAGGAVGLAQASPNDDMQWIGWGTGGTAEGVGNTALTTPASEARVQGTTSSPSARVHRVVGTLTAAGTKTITEVGLFDQLASGGTMLMRALFTGIPLEANDQITFTLDLTIVTP
jgi:hypothetical protein